MKWIKEVITGGYINLDTIQHIFISQNIDTDTGSACGVAADDTGTERYYLHIVPYSNDTEKLNAVKECRAFLENLMSNLMSCD